MIETAAECTQVAIGILAKLQSVEYPAETVFQIVEHRINPPKFSHLIRKPSIHYHGLMRASQRRLLPNQDVFFERDQQRATRIISTNGKSCGHKKAAKEAAEQQYIILAIDEFP